MRQLYLCFRRNKNSMVDFTCHLSLRNQCVLTYVLDFNLHLSKYYLLIACGLWSCPCEGNKIISSVNGLVHSVTHEARTYLQMGVFCCLQEDWITGKCTGHTAVYNLLFGINWDVVFSNLDITLQIIFLSSVFQIIEFEDLKMLVKFDSPGICQSIF